MLQLYDKAHNFIGEIVHYKDLKIESEISDGDKTLTFTFLGTATIENEMYVRTEKDEFVVKEVPATTGSFPEIVCALNLEALEKDMWQTFSITSQTIDAAAKTVLAGTGWTVGECDVTKQRNAGMVQVSTKEVLQNLATAFMCDIVFDTINQTVSFYTQLGEDKGVYFISGLNLKKVQKKSTSYDYYTRIIPIGEDGLTIESVNGGKNYLENYQYSNKVLTYLWKDESYTDAQALMDDAGLKLDDLSKPEKSFSVEVRNLAAQASKYSVLSYSLGDTVRLVDVNTDTMEKQRIKKITHYPDEPNRDTCEIANTVLTFEELQEKYQAASDIINYTISGDGRYTGTIKVSDILNFEDGISDSSTIKGMNDEIAAVELSVGTIEANMLTAEEAALKYALITDLDATNIEVGQISGDFADFKTTTTDELAANKALIDEVSGNLADFKTVTADEIAVAKGWMLEGSIGDAQISSVSANKLTAGTIDAANITVKNLNADNITTGTINGQLIGAGSVDLDRLRESVATEGDLEKTNATVKTINDTVDGYEQKFTEFTDNLETVSQTASTASQTANANASSIKELTTKYDSVSRDVGSLTEKESNLEQTVDKFKTEVSSTYVTKDDADATYGSKTDVQSAKTTAEQTAEKFSWIVESGTSSSNFEITDRLAELTADYINLNGSVTLSGLSDDVKTAMESDTLGMEEITCYLTDESGNKITDEFGNYITSSQYGINVVSRDGSGTSTVFSRGKAISIPDFTVPLYLKEPTSGYIVYRVGTGALLFEYLDGWYSYPVSCTGTETSVTPSEETDIFLASYDANGWAQFEPPKTYRDIQYYIMLGEWASDAISETTTINGGLIKTGTIIADKIASGAITTDKLTVGAVTTDKLDTNAITSKNYTVGSGTFASTGTKLDLANGSILSKQFVIDSSGNATFGGNLNAASGTFKGTLSGVSGSFSGSINAVEGKVGGWTIGDGLESSSDYSGSVRTLILSPDMGLQFFPTSSKNSLDRAVIYPNGDIYGSNIYIYGESCMYTASNTMTISTMATAGTMHSTTVVYFTIPINKPMVNISSVAITISKIALRQNGKYICGTSSSGIAPSKITPLIRGTGLYVSVTMSASTNATNLDTVGIWCDTIKITFK